MKECGVCCHWMKKTDCPREAKGIMVDFAMWSCDKYSEEPWFTKLMIERGITV